MTGHGTQVCVVGAGPRGICVVQRLCANAAERRPGRVPVVVHVVDPMLFSGGATWSTDQPAELLMNTVASQVTLFTDDSVDCEGPILPGPSLHEWARFVDHFDPYEEYPEHVRAEAARLGPDDYPTRALYGHYLNWALRRLIARPGARVTVVPHRETAVALDDAPDGSQTVTLSDGTLLSGLAAVVLAQGHLPMLPDSQEYGLAWYARENGLTYVPAGNPSQADLTGVR
ncbi:FAD/NAD(P)-binding protein, partial [Streptomyces sp. UNOC14_S4]|uniref:FAD/NAD(P)-binding protein n=1 Tax=Streptomyces sp. UNOC14_S4 TaxID=2872340 RepID=UPI001E49E6FE